MSRSKPFQPNEYEQELLKRELEQVIAKRYGEKEKEWRANETLIGRWIDYDWQKSGKHYATLIFAFKKKDGSAKEDRVLFEYRVPIQRSDPPYRYMVRDNND